MNFYVTLGDRDPATSAAFYDAVLAVLGWSKLTEFPGWRAYSEGGLPGGFIFWIVKPFDGEPASVGDGTMVGFPTKTRAQVDAFHAAALAHGGSEEGAPGLRPHDGPTWHAAYLRDPSGNKLAVVCNS